MKYDINTLEWDRISEPYGDFYQADLETTDDVATYSAVHEVHYQDGVSVSLAVGNPQTGKWFDSRQTRDWPELDRAFGRENWQNWIDEKAAEVALDD